MVFESIVVELINRYLGDFVENLDTSQLKIGIWGGDVVLKNLNLKESALDEMDLPIKIKAGHIGKLTLKIPWKNLYTEPVIAEIDGIYALAVPNIGIKYDEEKEKKALQDAKQKKLLSIEAMKKAEEEKDKPTDPKKDSFVEKLATQVIKNLQIKVANIHVRYEDRFTNPSSPVAIGVTLQELLFQTTDENWKETVIKESVTQIYKLVRLESLAVYWNSESEMLHDKESSEILATLKSALSKENPKTDFQYLFKPISAVAHLRLNTKPELSEFTIPKIFLTLVFDEIALALNKSQYDDILEILESMERMNLKAKYKKTRPALEYKGNAAKWWHHAYAVVLEHTVQRRRKMWSWEEMKSHRARLRKYKELYMKQLSAKKLSKQETEEVKTLEASLDVLNIVMARNLAETEVAKLGAKKKEEKSQGWFGGWFGGGKAKQSESSESVTGSGRESLGKEFQKQFDAQEQAKLYKAIGYEEDAVDTTFPTEFVATRLVTKLNKFSLSLSDSTKQDHPLLKTALSEIYVSFGQRPAANAIRLDAKVDKLRVSGILQHGITPKLVNSVKEESASLLSVMFETNPLDGECDSRVRVNSNPIEIIYDALTINQLADFFKPPESVRLKQFSEGAMERYKTIQSQTATGMMHAMEEKKYMDIQVNLMPSYIIVPATGRLTKDVNLLLLNLGNLKVSSDKNKVKGPDISKMSSVEVTNLAYDKFNISLENVQLLYVQQGDSWEDPNRSANSPLYVLRPLSISLGLEKCIFAEDANLPKMRINGELPLVSIGLSDSKLKGILDLVQSIPFPESSETPEADPFDNEPSEFSSKDINVTKLDLHTQTRPVAGGTVETSAFVNMTTLAVSFVIQEVLVEIQETVEGVEMPLLKLHIDRIGADMKQRTFDMKVEAYLGAIYLQHLQFKFTPGITEQLAKCNVITGEVINIINTPSDKKESNLLVINFLQANKKGPEFATLYQNTAQSMTVEFEALDILIHEGVIQSLMKFAKKFESEAPPEVEITKVSTRRQSIASSVASFGKMVKTASKKKENSEMIEVLDFKVAGLIDSIQIGICSEHYLIMHTKIGGLEAGVSMYKSRLAVSAVIRSLVVLDPDLETMHPQILSVTGSEILDFHMTIFNNGTQGDRFDDPANVDMDIRVNLGRIRIIFINKFVMSLMNFLDNFSMAKAKLDEASQAMKEASKDVAKNIKEHSTRVRFAVNVKAPVVIVPRNSKSEMSGMVYLGDISIKNEFVRLSAGAKKGQAHIMEQLSVKLTQLQFSRGIMGKNGVEAEIIILQPMTFSVDVKRNLSEGWFHGIPDIAVSGVLETVEVKLSFEDLSMLMLVINENLAEKPIGSSEPVKEVAPATAEAAATPEAEPMEEIVTHQAADTTMEILDEEPYTKMNVDFKLVSILVQLYKGSSQLESKNPERPVEKMLTEISLQQLVLDLNMMSDTSMKANVSLYTITMDDMRVEKKGGITKMLCLTEKTEAPVAKLLDVKFEQNATEDKTVLLHLSSLHICVCMEFLMRVVDFFTKSMPPDKPKTIKESVEEQEMKDHKAKVAKTSPVQKEEVPAKGSLDVTLTMEKPEIILIEDQMNKNTNSLIVDVAINFRLRQTPEVQAINGSITGLSLVSCIFEQPKTRKNVLAPCDINLISNAPHSKDHHVDINVSDIIINITPSTIHLLSSVASGMVPAADEEVIESSLETYSTIWDRKPLAECSFWFTHSVVEPGTDLDKALTSSTEEKVVERKEHTEPFENIGRGEQLLMAVSAIVVKLEGGVGHRTVPLLIVESAFSAQVLNWTTLLAVESSLSLEVAYYNEQLGVWEPIIEPVMGQHGKDPNKWELAVEVSKTDDSLLEEDSDDGLVLPPPKMVINVVATEPLEVLMTKTCLEVLNHLGQAFNEAYQLQAMEGTMGDELAPYIFRNETGMDMQINVDAAYQPAPDSQDINPQAFKTGESLSVVHSAATALHRQKSIIRDTQKQKEVRVGFQFANNETRFDTPITRAGKKSFTVGKDKHQVVCFVDAKIGQKIVTFMSVLRVTNHLSVPVEVFSTDQKCGIIDPGATKPLPLDAVYHSSEQLSFKLLSSEADVFAQSEQGLKWKPVSSASKTHQVKCVWQNANGKAPVYFNVSPKVESVPKEGSEKETASVTTLHLYPTVILHNLLPFDIQYLLEGTEPVLLGQGENVPLDHAAVDQSTLELIIPKYRGMEWNGKKTIKHDVPELSVWTFKGDDNGKSVSMDLGLHCKENSGSFDLRLYSPYWIINMSEQNLEFKEDEKDAPFSQAADDRDIMLFYFREKSLFGTNKKKVILKVADGEWSDKFSLDTVGSSGNVTCKHKTLGHPLEVGVKIILSNSGLTKIVTFTPFYMLLNASTVPLCLKEETKDEWMKIQPGECKAFYPVTMTKEKDVKVRAKVEDSDYESVPFFVNKAHTTLLKLSDKYGGLNADCQVRESAMITTFNLYKPGMATVQFVNQTFDCDITIKQSGDSENAIELPPMSSQLYTWESPTGKKEIFWSCGDKKNVKGQIEQDGIDEFSARQDVKVYWVSFLDGMQRVLMFTQDVALATMAQEAGELEQVEQEINMRIQNMGFSLINNLQMVEVAYMGITSSGVIWEEKRKRFKALKVKDCIALETGYQKYLNEMAVGKRKSGLASLEHKLEVDFEKMEMIKPRKCVIRRSFEDGVWVQFKASPHSKQLHAKINRLQFDNQLRHAIFPTVLSPLPPPKSVAADSVPKPFVEVSVMMRIHEHSQLQQIKYFKVLVQEMNLKVDQGFLNAVLEMFASNTEINREVETQNFVHDVENTKHNLKEEAGLSIQAAQPNFYDYFHISPIKVHLSFSLQGIGSDSGSTPVQANVLNVFLQSVGVVLTDVQDVVFKLGYFERNNSFYNNSQLTSEFVRHYSGQAIKQMYVLVLGLDVLGNPFGLLRGLSEGIEDLFYEPYQGAIQGPEEFAEGLALGVRSLFGHAVGGAAGAVSRITGTLGKGLAALTLDDDYQKKRREQMLRKPASAKEGFARGGKGLVMGVVDGVTGIVRKPVEGAKQEGVSGFFKGMGKGLVGVVTRPTSGVVDFASSSLEGIKRITDMTEEIHRLRPPRHMHKDGIIRPYNRQEAEGYNLLAETEKGKFADSDEYLTHIKVKDDGKVVFIVTDRRVMLAKRGEIFGSWDTEWVYTYQEMKASPKQTAKGLEIPLKEEKKKKLFGGGGANKKDLIIMDQKLVKEVLEKITEAMAALNLENGV